MFGYFGGIFAMFAGTGESEFMWPVVHIGDRSDFHPAFESQVVATVIAGQELARHFENFYIPLSRCLNYVIIPSVAENFHSEGRPPWAPLSPVTVAKRGSAHPILGDTGQLYDIVTSPRGWIVSTADLFPNEFTLPKYAGFHQTGTRFMPMREYMSFQEDDKILIDTIFREWVEQVIAGYWGDQEGPHENGMPGFFEGGGGPSFE